MTLGNKASFPGMDRYPSWLWWTALLIAFPLFSFFVWHGEHFKAFVSTLSVGVIVTLAVTLRDYYKTTSYWITVSFSCAFHVVVISSIQVEYRHFPGTVLTPFAVVDLLLWQAIFVGVFNVFHHRSK